MKMLILAGGFGTRLQSVLAGEPKALAPVGDVPFLYLQLESWIAQGLTSFVFLLHHRANLIIDFLKAEQDGLLKNCDVQWLIETEPMGTGGAVAYAIERLGLSESFLLTNADTWLGNGIADLWRAHPQTMAVIESRGMGRYGQVYLDSELNITAFHEKVDIVDAGWINAGLYHFDTKVFESWDHLPFSLEEKLLTTLAFRGELKAVVLHTDFIDIGIPNDYFRFCRWIAADRKGSLCS